VIDPTTGELPKTIWTANSKFDLDKARQVALKVTQNPGTTIFVPSGWYHEVVNSGYHVPMILIDCSLTLSINHNWFNASCLSRMYDSLVHQRTLSIDAIRDLQGMDPIEFEDLVQGLMKANYGMDWNLFWELVEWNVKHRGDEHRFCLEEENVIVSKVLEKWLNREEAQYLTTLKERVIAFRDYLTST
jgi:JmjC domain, hydroxylase